MGTCCLESMVKILIGACYGRILHLKTFQSRQFFVQFCTFLLHSFSYRNSYSVRFLCITSFVFRSFCNFHRLQIHFASEFAATSSHAVSFSFVCHRTLFRSTLFKSHSVCKYLRLVCFLSCIFVVSQLSFAFLSNFQFCFYCNNRNSNSMLP